MVEGSKSALRSDKSGLLQMLGVTKKSYGKGIKYIKVSSKGNKEQKEDKKRSD